MNKPATFSTPQKLCDQSLRSLPASISAPTYDRSRLTAGIVHIGLGNFHRAHQAWYVHRLMQDGQAHDWAIIGAGVRPYDTVMRDKLKAQDFLTTLIELDPSATSAEIIGSMIDYAPIDMDNAGLVNQLCDPAIRIVSLTITEGGYFLDPVSGNFDSTHVEILHDVNDPQSPRTVFGAIIAALDHRRKNGHGPLTLLSCDNLTGNGTILKQAVMGLARMIDSALAQWIDENCSFPNSMVDCIVPATGEKEMKLAENFGISDAVPVSHEKYRQWVVEDDFCAGRPPLENVGVIFTEEVHKYETMKIRLLNAEHQVIANVGEILSLDTIADCMADPQILAFFRKVGTEEIIPGIAPLPSINPLQYLDLVETRFANPAIRDTTRRVAFDGSSRHTGFVLPILREGLEAGRPTSGLALVEALWARMCAGAREDGTEIEPNDPIWDTLRTNAESARENPASWLAQKDIYGDLAMVKNFSCAFEDWLNLIWARGSRKAVQTYLDQAGID